MFSRKFIEWLYDGLLMVALVLMFLVFPGGCTVIAWSSGIDVETTDGLIVIEDDNGEQEESQTDKKKSAS